GLSLTAAEFRQMAAIYEVTELATAVKPWLLELLLGRGGDAAMYLDPDIEVFAPLDDIGELARRHGIVLIPHALAPLPADGRKPTPQDIADAGVYNLGFLAVGPQAGPFLDWWGQRLRRDCIVSVEEGLFVDQRLLDALPAYFEHTILRDPACDVAYWNLHERTVRWTGSGYVVNGTPLRFFHFSGFDPRRPEVLSKHQGDRPRIDLARAPALARRCREYAAKLSAAGYREAASQPYGYARSAAGLPLDRRMRRLYREALIAADRGAPLDAPDPFDPRQAEGFAGWLRAPSTLSPQISRYLSALYLERGDLRTAFPAVPGGDVARYIDWVMNDGRADPPIPNELRPIQDAVKHRPARGPIRNEGVNVAGYVKAELGVGEAARLIIKALRAAKVPYAVIPYTIAWNRQAFRFDDRGTSEPNHDVNLICVNADQLPGFAERIGSEFMADRYNVGMWWWEVERFPESMASAASLIDEIWVGSRHAGDAISRAVSKPVRVFPLPIVKPEF